MGDAYPLSEGPDLPVEAFFGEKLDRLRDDHPLSHRGCNPRAARGNLFLPLSAWLFDRGHGVIFLDERPDYSQPLRPIGK